MSLIRRGQVFPLHVSCSLISFGTALGRKTAVMAEVLLQFFALSTSDSSFCVRQAVNRCLYLLHFQGLWDSEPLRASLFRKMSQNTVMQREMKKPECVCFVLDCGTSRACKKGNIKPITHGGLIERFRLSPRRM